MHRSLPPHQFWRGEGADDDLHTTHDDESNSEEDSSDKEEAKDNDWRCNKCTKAIIGIIHHCNICDDGNFNLCTIC